MGGLQGFAVHLACPLAPKSKRIEVFLHGPMPGPKDLGRHGEFLVAIGVVMLDVDRRRRAIVLAARMDRCGIAEGIEIFVKRLVAERIMAASLVEAFQFPKRFGISTDELLR